MSEYFPDLKSSGGRVNVELDLSKIAKRLISKLNI